jgi:uncharacterized membrane protein
VAVRGRSRPGDTRQLLPSSGGVLHESDDPSSVLLHELSSLLVVSQLSLDAQVSEPAAQASQKLGPSGGGGGGGGGGVGGGV